MKDQSGKTGPDQVSGIAPFGTALKAEFPEIEKIVQFSGQSSVSLKYGERSFPEDRVSSWIPQPSMSLVGKW